DAPYFRAVHRRGGGVLRDLLSAVAARPHRRKAPGEAELMAQAMVEITELHKHFGKLAVLRGVSLSVAAGEVVVIIGASGSGKTTLLRCINHLEVPDGGEVRVDGIRLTDRAPVICTDGAGYGRVVQQLYLY